MTGQVPRETAEPELGNGSGSVQGRRHAGVPRDDVLAVFATSPVLDPVAFRADLDAVIDQDPLDRP